MPLPFSVVHARRAAKLAAGAAVLIGLGGCAAALGSMAPGADTLLPHSVLLRRPALDQGTFDVAVYRGTAADTAGHEFTTVTVSELQVPNRDDESVLVRQWGPPASRMDSLVIDRRSLEPVRESYVSRGVRYHYTFTGAQVSGTLRRPHAAPLHITRVFDHPVFALNEIAPLVSSLDCRVGMNEIVPVFSETSHSLQRDTLTVLRRAVAANRAPEWIVRFADPLTITQYAVDAATHHILDAVATRRGTEMVTRYQYPGATG